MDLTTPIEKISNVGIAYQRRLKKLGIKTVEDLLYHFPHRYEDFSNIIPISKIEPNQAACVQGQILEIENSRTWKKRIILTRALIQDQSGAITIVWFNQPYLIRILKPGDKICVAGRVNFGNEGLYFNSPAYEKISPSARLTHTGRIVPVYPETEGLSSKWIRWILKPLLVKLKNEITDSLPQAIVEKYHLLPLQTALWQIHFPDSLDLANRARERFSFEELFVIELRVLRQRAKIASLTATAIPLNLKAVQGLVNSLPFKLTDAQKKSVWQILKDIERPRPMNRLLEGDVGSGKTVVAAIAAMNTARAGYQTVFMAPTEVLTKQHFKTVSELLKNAKVNIGLLTGKEDKFISKKLKNEIIEISRKKLLERARTGEMDILIGTHALIQDKVKFGKLALVIIDEQHRFGVEQRAKLLSQTEPNQKVPHLLSMTATPIPRTLALTVYGDLDLSLINQLPKGRKRIITKVIPPSQRDAAYAFIKKEVKRGRQVFVICPRIESADTKQAQENQNQSFKTGRNLLSWAEVKAVKSEYEHLSKKIFPDLNIEILHGKMTPKQKEKIMKDFKNKKIDILVSTSVIEVGIDIPNATVMMIEGAERFGLAQLYQFRGRVGRSHYQSYCLLFTDSPAQRTTQRLKALTQCENSFELSEKDMEIRGPGDLMGVRQWGIPDLAMSALKNISLVEKTRELAKQTLKESPNLEKYPFLKKKLGRFQQRVHLE